MDHDCSGCRGIKFQGANVTCCRCLRPFYLECLATKKEVQYLISTLNAGAPQTTSPISLPNKVKQLFGHDKMFDFTCPKCKASGSYMDKMDETKRQLTNEFEAIMKAKDDEIQAYKTQIEEIQMKLNQCDAVNVQYATQINQLQSDVMLARSANTELEKSNAELLNKVASSAMQMEGINSDSRTIDLDKIMNRFDVLTNDIEARIKLECDRVARTVCELNGKDDQHSNAKRRKFEEMTGQTLIAPTGHAHQLQIDLTTEGKGITTKLKPPKKNDDDKRDVYQIHVSQFDNEHTEQHIESYICENTGISANGLFKVAKLPSKRRNQNDSNVYCSFKITTLHYEVYKKVSNTELWEPEFKVRDFISSPQQQNKNNANWYTNAKQQQSRQFSSTNEAQYGKGNGQASRKSTHVNTAASNQFGNAPMTPIGNTAKAKVARRVFAAKNITEQQQATPMRPEMQQPYSSQPNQSGQNFQMTNAYHPPMAQSAQVYRYQQQQQQPQQQQQYQQQQRQYNQQQTNNQYHPQQLMYPTQQMHQAQQNQQ